MTVHGRPSANLTASRGSGLEALSVVIPTYDEGDHLRRAVDSVRRACEVAGLAAQVVVVDDGSTEPRSVAVVEELAALPEVTVVRQSNSGRYAARATGLARVVHTHVLLLDARVEIDDQSLLRIKEQVAQGVEVWNFDVHPASQTWGAAFWTGITKVWWRDYFRHRRTVHFGVDDFDRYPKGTGAFFAPVRVLRDATTGFTSFFEQRELASDDTRLLRAVAANTGINLGPEVFCRHRAKTGGSAWTRQCYYRGTTFVDGYLGSAERATPYLRGGAVAMLLALVWTLRHPRSTLVAALLGCLGAGGVTRWSGGTAKESAAVAGLAPVFGILFGAGVLRGLRMAAGRRD